MANNPYVNKVVKEGTTLIDISSDTVSPSSLAQGYTAHDASGAQIVGTMTGGSMIIRDEEDEHGGVIRHITAGNVVTGTIEITENGTYDVAQYADAEVNVQTTPNLQVKTNIAPTTSSQMIRADSGYDGLSSVQINAMPNGTAGTPTAAKGTVSNHSVLITPSVTNTTGYITGGTKTGTAVSVSASELVSGNLSITENGTGIDVANYSTVSVAVSGGGESGSMSDPIRFFDYDGTLVASYTSVPESLPSIPTHSKLTNGTWNYTLAQITTQFNAMGTCDIGANYDTVSGKTEIDIELRDGRLHPYLSLAIEGTVEIDWGDGSTPDTVTGTSITTRQTNIHHEYAAAGSYTIKISKTSGTGYSLSCTATYFLLNKNNSTANANQVYADCVRAVRVGTECGIGGYAFRNCTSLSSISLPNSVTSVGSCMCQNCYSLSSISIPSGLGSLGSNAFSACYSLKSVSLPPNLFDYGTYAFSSCCSLESISLPRSVNIIGGNSFAGCSLLSSVTIPDSIAQIGNYAFSSCYSLKSVSMPNSVSTIGTYAFQACYSLKSISISSNLNSISTYTFSGCWTLTSLTIPSGITSIPANAFSNCYGMAEYHVLSTTPPTLESYNAFNNIPTECIIYVPQGCLEAYQTATNWSTYASRMREES